MFCYGTFTHTPTRKCVASLCGNGNGYSSGAEMHDGYSFNSPQHSWGEKEKRSSALALARPMTCRSLCLVRISYRMKPRPPFPRVHFASRAAQSRGHLSRRPLGRAAKASVARGAASEPKSRYLSISRRPGGPC